jgi:hypothetical protein
LKLPLRSLEEIANLLDWAEHKGSMESNIRAKALAALSSLSSSAGAVKDGESVRVPSAERNTDINGRGGAS